MALYNRELEKDNCGFGLIAHMEGEASHKLVRTAIMSLARMAHRGGIAADGKTGDGCGLLMKKPDSFLRAVIKEQDGKVKQKWRPYVIDSKHEVFAGVNTSKLSLYLDSIK